MEPILDYMKTAPYKHQMDALNMSLERPAFALFMDMGTGKSKVVIDNMAYLYMHQKIDGCLILANKGSYTNWVTSELPKHLHSSVNPRVLLWQSASGKARELSVADVSLQFDGLRIVVMNIEALAYPKGYNIAEAFLKSSNSMMVIDESTSIKNEIAKRTKAALYLGRLATYRRIMTGEPITNNPLDIYSQGKFLGPNIIRYSSYFVFRSVFANMIIIAAGQRQFRKITGFKNLDQLNDLISTFSYRIKKEDCLDLPPKVYQTYNIELTKEQSKLYNQLREDAVAFFSTHEVTSAPLAITKLLRMHQVVCGHLKDDDGVVHEVENNRLEALVDLLQETDTKVIIWATYRHNIKAITERLRKEFGPRSTVDYFGDTEQSDRIEAVERFQTDKETRFFVGNPKTGGYGLTLTAASTVIYYSNNFDLEVRLQSEDRAHRIGQTKSVNYVDFVSPGTIDEKIIKALREKKNLAQAVLGDEWKQWI